MAKLLININRLVGFIANIDAVLDFIKNPKENTDEFDIDKHTITQIIEWFRIDRSLINSEMLERYNKMSSNELNITFTLAEPEIIEQRIVTPLVAAKRNACTGDFLASIALSGLVGEMLTVLVWEINSDTRRSKDGALLEDKSILITNFDKIQQSLRVNIIEAFGYINLEEAKIFRDLSSLRNQVLHRWTDSYSKDEIEKIAINVFSCATLLVKKIIQLELADSSSVKINPKVLNYISSKK